MVAGWVKTTISTPEGFTVYSSIPFLQSVDASVLHLLWENQQLISSPEKSNYLGNVSIKFSNSFPLSCAQFWLRSDKEIYYNNDLLIPCKLLALRGISNRKLKML